MQTQELYQSVTNEVIRQLQEGVPPWVRPWRDSKLKGIGMIPSNLVSGRLYSGGNILLLWLSASLRGFTSLQYCTYQQVCGMGGAKVRKGEKATHVIFTKHVMRKDEESGEEKAGTLIKSYPVFNLDQIEGVPERYLVAQEPEDSRPTNLKAAEFAKGTGIRVDHGANKAAYYPARDEVVIPIPRVFVDEDAYWGTLFHELTHATGHKSRLDRTFGKRFGDSAYAAEELVAELGSAFLCARLGISASFRSASYIDSWLKVLAGDNRAIFTAASYAGHAADWLWKQAYRKEEQQQAAE